MPLVVLLLTEETRNGDSFHNLLNFCSYSDVFYRLLTLISVFIQIKKLLFVCPDSELRAELP
jgi:hypothetical protein